MNEPKPGNVQLVAVLIAAQKAEKKFRQLANRGEVTSVDVADLKRVVEILRALSRRQGIQSIDLDSRAERRKDRA